MTRSKYGIERVGKRLYFFIDQQSFQINTGYCPDCDDEHEDEEVRLKWYAKMVMTALDRLAGRDRK